MDADERQICLYLKSCPGQFISLREICRRADGKRRFRQEHDWAGPVLNRLVEKGIIESDSTGHYRLKPTQKKKPTRWIAPQIRKVLEQSGKPFNDVLEIEDPEDSLEP